MNSKERVRRAISFKDPDRIPVRNQCMDAALFEHGWKLPELYKVYKGDFGDPAPKRLPVPEPKHILADGGYKRLEKDIWGVEWEYVKFGIHGHPLSRPLDDIGVLKDYKTPVSPASSGKIFESEKAGIKNRQGNVYVLEGWINLFEIMHSVRNFEDVLVDVFDDTKEINRLADIIVNYQTAMVDYLIALGVDGIMLADDWGSQNSLLIGKDIWRAFFKPRYAKLINPIKDAGIDVFFHSCGHIMPLVGDLAEIGVNVLWPQYASNDPLVLAKILLENKMCIELHMDRQKLLTLGTPAEIISAVKSARNIFGNKNGGIIYHGEIDNGFPFVNIEALLNAFSKYR